METSVENQSEVAGKPVLSHPFPLIFSSEIVEQIWNSSSPSSLTFKFVEKHLRRKLSPQRYNTGYISALSQTMLNCLIDIEPSTESHFDLAAFCLNVLFHLIDKIKTDRSLDMNDSQQVQLVDQIDCSALRAQLFAKLKAIIHEQLNLKEISERRLFINVSRKLIEHFQTVIPLLKLFYLLQNVNRKIKHETMRIVISNPLLVPPLVTFEEVPKEQKLVTEEESSSKEQKVTEDRKDQLLKESKTEQQKLNEAESKAAIEKYKLKMEELGLSEETKKLIEEKVQSMRANCRIRLEERNKELETKLKDVENNLKGKKK